MRKGFSSNLYSSCLEIKDRRLCKTALGRGVEIRCEVFRMKVCQKVEYRLEQADIWVDGSVKRSHKRDNWRRNDKFAAASGSRRRAGEDRPGRFRRVRDRAPSHH